MGENKIPEAKTPQNPGVGARPGQLTPEELERRHEGGEVTESTETTEVTETTETTETTEQPAPAPPSGGGQP